MAEHSTQDEGASSREDGFDIVNRSSYTKITMMLFYGKHWFWRQRRNESPGEPNAQDREHMGRMCVVDLSGTDCHVKFPTPSTDKQCAYYLAVPFEDGHVGLSVELSSPTSRAHSGTSGSFHYCMVEPGGTLVICDDPRNPALKEHEVLAAARRIFPLMERTARASPRPTRRITRNDWKYFYEPCVELFPPVLPQEAFDDEASETSGAEIEEGNRGPRLRRRKPGELRAVHQGNYALALFVSQDWFHYYHPISVADQVVKIDETKGTCFETTRTSHAAFMKSICQGRFTVHLYFRVFTTMECPDHSSGDCVLRYVLDMSPGRDSDDNVTVHMYRCKSEHHTLYGPLSPPSLVQKQKEQRSDGGLHRLVSHLLQSHLQKQQEVDSEPTKSSLLTSMSTPLGLNTTYRVEQVDYSGRANVRKDKWESIELLVMTRDWHPEIHTMLSEDFQQRTKIFLLCNQRFEGTTPLDCDCIELIMKYWFQLDQEAVPIPVFRLHQFRPSPKRSPFTVKNYDSSHTSFHRVAATTPDPDWPPPTRTQLNIVKGMLGIVGMADDVASLADPVPPHTPCPAHHDLLPLFEDERHPRGPPEEDDHEIPVAWTVKGSYLRPLYFRF